MERIPQKSPLPCYGLEHDRRDPKCQHCPHFKPCLAYMGSRADKVPLDRIKFEVVPKEFQLEALAIDDPELPHLQRLYTDCFSSVFHKHPTDNVSLYKKEIASNALHAKCSVRMFMLSNMVAHIDHQKEIIEHTEKMRAAAFKAKMLTGSLAVKRAKTYQELCKNRYGTFSLNSLSVLRDSEDKDDLESTMLNSEVTAGKWVVRYKIHNGDQPELPMFESEELQLAPEWLALEASYRDLVLRPYVDHKTGTETLQRHRFNVYQVHGYYKRHPNAQRMAWITRQKMMPEAVKIVVSSFNHRMDDFLYTREPVLDIMQFWKSFALTIRHHHCWLYLNNLPSYFTPRRHEVLEGRS